MKDSSELELAAQSPAPLFVHSDPEESTPLALVSKTHVSSIDASPNASLYKNECNSWSFSSRMKHYFKRLPGARALGEKIAALNSSNARYSQGENTAGNGDSASNVEYTTIVERNGYIGSSTGKLLISGMSCGSCAARIEQSVSAMEGVFECNVNFTTALCTITVDREDRLQEVMEAITMMGYSVTLFDESQSAAMTNIRDVLERTQEIRENKIQFIGAAVLAAPLAVIMFLMSMPNAMHGQYWMNVADTLQFILTTPIVFYFGSGYFVRAWRELQHMSFTMDTLVAIGTGVSYLYSVFAYISNLFTPVSHMATYFDTAGMLLAFMLLGRYLEAYAKRSTGNALVQLMGLVPAVAIVVTPEGDVEIPSELVQKGARLRVLAGDRIPVDGVVVEGMSEVDEHIVNGEAVPKLVKPGVTVIGGTTNVTAMLILEAQRVGEDTMVSQILRVVQEAQTSKPPVQRIADKIAAFFVPLVIVFSLLVFLTWMVLGFFDLYPAEWRTGKNESVTLFAFNFFIASVVAACPCALGLATPTAIMVGTGVGARSGILVRSSTTLESVRRSRSVVFDKTGTITHGRLEIVFHHCFSEDADLLLSAVRAVGRTSTHPVAKALQSLPLPGRRAAAPAVLRCETLSGLGTAARVRDAARGTAHAVHVGSLSLMRRAGVAVPPEALRAARREGERGHTAVLGALDGTAALVVGLADSAKAEARGVVRELRERGWRVRMVSGDQRGVAEKVAREVGIRSEDVHAEALPVEKAQIVERLQREGEVVVFVGDGINDSPALAQADVGVALGAGTDIAMMAADAVLVRNTLVDLLNLEALSVATVRRVYGNFVWAFGYNIIALPLASGMLYPFFHVRLPPLLAGIAMVLSSLSVLSSSLSLRCFRPYKTEDFISSEKQSSP